MSHHFKSKFFWFKKGYVEIGLSGSLAMPINIPLKRVEAHSSMNGSYLVFQFLCWFILIYSGDPASVKNLIDLAKSVKAKTGGEDIG